MQVNHLQLTERLVGELLRQWVLEPSPAGPLACASPVERPEGSAGGPWRGRLGSRASTEVWFPPMWSPARPSEAARSAAGRARDGAAATARQLRCGAWVSCRGAACRTETFSGAPGGRDSRDGTAVQASIHSTRGAGPARRSRIRPGRERLRAKALRRVAKQYAAKCRTECVAVQAQAKQTSACGRRRAPRVWHRRRGP